MSGLAVVFTAVAAVSAVVNWVAVARQRASIEYVAKPLTMVALTGLAVAISPDDPARQAWFVAAAVFCLAGDVFLMLPQDRFVPGLVAFLLAHVCYAGGFLAGGDLSGARGLLGALIVALAVATVGRMVIAAVRQRASDLFAPVVGYLVVISLMVLIAFAAGPALAIVGALLFYVSDSVIAWRRFRGAGAWAPVTIMVTYHAAQFALIGSLAIPSG